MNYVWYACYGSNINKERFMRYINRCSDTTPPMEDRPYEFMHPVFFAGKSVIWENKGTAFLDVWTEKAALGRIYKITEEQYQEVSWMEGPKYQNRIELGTLEGIPVVSFTCTEKQERAVPFPAYFETILSGLKETYPTYRESALAERLIHGIFSEEEMKVLECLWEAEDGLTNGAISEAIHLGDDKERKVIESLLKLGVVRQDWGSWELEADDEGAVFYIERDERELVDRIMALKRGAGSAG